MHLCVPTQQQRGDGLAAWRRCLQWQLTHLPSLPLLLSRARCHLALFLLPARLSMLLLLPVRRVRCNKDDLLTAFMAGAGVPVEDCVMNPGVRCAPHACMLQHLLCAQRLLHDPGMHAPI